MSTIQRLFLLFLPFYRLFFRFMSTYWRFIIHFQCFCCPLCKFMSTIWRFFCCFCLFYRLASYFLRPKWRHFYDISIFFSIFVAKLSSNRLMCSRNCSTKYSLSYATDHSAHLVFFLIYYLSIPFQSGQ